MRKRAARLETLGRLYGDWRGTGFAGALTVKEYLVKNEPKNNEIQRPRGLMKWLFGFEDLNEMMFPKDEVNTRANITMPDREYGTGIVAPRVWLRTSLINSLPCRMSLEVGGVDTVVIVTGPIDGVLTTNETILKPTRPGPILAPPEQDTIRMPGHELFGARAASFDEFDNSDLKVVIDALDAHLKVQEVVTQQP
jgi:hypothetical protein